MGVQVGIVVELDGKRGKKPSFDELTAIVADDMKRVNQQILKRMESPVALIPQLAGHVISAGGKRLRPMLTLASAKLCGYHGERHVTLATCIEFIHTATLLHDDVVDESQLRRGLETANSVWGNQASVLVGDFLFSRSFELMVEDGSVKVMGILSSAAARLAEGEVMQLLTSYGNQRDRLSGCYQGENGAIIRRRLPPRGCRRRPAEDRGRSIGRLRHEFRRRLSVD